ncbi:hypothetical protein PPMP20_12140 [Paraburkholderia phymatum]|uniref:Uncharacterized protein n=1 Tax=Paraburkholderia phymatum (strain DSM 17167 / CIP 108236 / LMG 21445 / STM815) TaxID=391038 RepID=B2JFS4_PARP8|nr:hypothetical protein [Paraburkholderia phymatum]ACC71549.1 hypothetical protein Bphy_2374 [Paraburkholderia phymatum STM815]
MSDNDTNDDHPASKIAEALDSHQRRCRVRIARVCPTPIPRGGFCYANALQFPVRRYAHAIAHARANVFIDIPKIQRFTLHYRILFKAVATSNGKRRCLTATARPNPWRVHQLR